MARRIGNLVPTLWFFIEMKEKYCLRWLVLVFATLGCSFHSAYAHHSFAFEFDADQQGSLTGEITEVRFVNPHVVYRMQAGQPDGTEEDWQLQTHNVGVMLRLGWTAETIQVGDHAALTQLITDKNFRVSIRIGQDRALGLFIPTHGKYGLLEGVRKSMPLTEGEIAYTSGISEIYPPNIPVARVVSIKRDENNPFQHIVVELVGSLENLDYVFIIL